MLYDKKSNLPQRKLRVKPVHFSLLNVLGLAACGGDSDNALGGGTDSPTEGLTISGAVVKGPVENAIVFLDYNGDGQLSAGEPSQRTDSNGGFSFTDVDSAGPVIALTDGSSVDTSSGLVIDGMRLTAPEGSSVISPLTTIMQEGGLTNAQVVSALGLPDVDLTSFNPFMSDGAAETALAVEIAAQQVSVIVRSLSAAMQSAGVSEDEAADIAATAISSAIASTGTVDLTASSIVTSAIQNAVAELSSSQASAVSSIASEIATAAANVNSVIGAATDLTSSESVDAFRLIADLTTQIGEAVANGGDASEITSTDPDAVDETLAEVRVNSAPTGEVTITGTARQGETLTANTDALDDTDGLGTFNYQWKADGSAIIGATQASYTLSEAEVGSEITVDVSYTDGGNANEIVASASTSPVLHLVDAEGPALVSFSVRDNTLSPGETLYVDYDATDVSGIDVTQVLFYDKNGNQHRAEDRDDDGVAELIITDQMLSGAYTAELISMGDTTDLFNESIFYQDGRLSGDVDGSTHGFDLSILDFEVIGASDAEINEFTVVTPVVVSVSGETQWANTWYTGDADFAVDGDNITKWTYEGLGEITFDLGKDHIIDSVFVTFNGSVSNGNYVNLYIDDLLVASGRQPAGPKNWDIKDTIGRFVTYETVAEPHNDYLQIASWTEISELTILAQEIIA